MFDLFKNNKTNGGCFVLFDIGGTKMRVAASFDGEKIGKTAEAETPKDFASGVSLFSKLVAEVAGGRKISRGGGGIAGILSKDHASLFRSPNLPGWDGASVKAEFSRVLDGAPVLIENDAALACLAEATLGAGRGAPIVAYFTLSTGIGGARAVNGRIDSKVFGFEPGHQIITDDGRDLESHASGGALSREFGNLSEAKDEHIYDKPVSLIARGIYNSILLWSPDVVVLGGPLILGAHPIPFEKISEELHKLPRIFPELPEIKKAALGNEAGILGALLALKSN